MFYAGADQIYVFTSDGSTQNRSELELDATLVHESGHREGADVYHLAMSPEQIFRVDRFDEVGQKIRELVLRRNEYLKTGNIEVFNDDSKDFLITPTPLKTEKSRLLNPRTISGALTAKCRL